MILFLVELFSNVKCFWFFLYQTIIKEMLIYDVVFSELYSISRQRENSELVLKIYFRSLTNLLKNINNFFFFLNYAAVCNLVRTMIRNIIEKH